MKNNSIHPLAALLVVALFGSLLVAKFWYYDKAISVDRAGIMKVNPDGNAVLRNGTILFELSPDGSESNRVDLRKLGVDEPYGDFDFFRNGDLLINIDEYLPGFMDGIINFLRGPIRNSEPAGPEQGLHRCNLLTLECRKFSTQLPALHRAFSVFIDRGTDNIYLADTGRHLIRKLDSTGRLLAETLEGLNFPNHMMLHKDQLWVADTNHHVLKSLNPFDTGFGETIDQHLTVLDRSWRWPSTFTRAGNQWWVIVADKAMKNGRILILDNQGNQVRELPLPDGADPVSLVTLGNKVIISDWNLFAIHKFSLGGRQQGGFLVEDDEESLGYKLQKDSKLAENYQRRSNFAWLAFALCLVCGFIVAIIVGARNRPDDSELDQDSEQLIQWMDTDELPLNGLWIKPSKTFLFSLRVTGYILGTCAALILVLIYVKWSAILLMVASLLVLPLCMAWPVLNLARVRFCIMSQGIVVDAPHQQPRFEPYKNILWEKSSIVHDKRVIPFGHGPFSMYNRELIDRHLKPRLFDSNKVGQFKIVKYQWDSPDLFLKTTAAGAGLLLIVLLVIRYGFF